MSKMSTAADAGEYRVCFAYIYICWKARRVKETERSGFDVLGHKVKKLKAASGKAVN